jgi:alkanesulfonate monooxygenase SsuD/methylene tetrahydromethanopterin reductase-like flavin-dependent oxidoreductase (luciferase family)
VGHGIIVCVPEFNHPIKIADRTAVLDILSGGRLEVGTGRSATWAELGGFRADPDRTKKSWDEFVRWLPKMWTHETYAYDGEFGPCPSRPSFRRCTSDRIRLCGSRSPVPAPSWTRRIGVSAASGSRSVSSPSRRNTSPSTAGASSSAIRWATS